jgi:hypothetical protein
MNTIDRLRLNNNNNNKIIDNNNSPIIDDDFFLAPNGLKRNNPATTVMDNVSATEPNGQMMMNGDASVVSDSSIKSSRYSQKTNDSHVSKVGLGGDEFS